jgi:peptidoglycan-associated lipoprotein
MKLGAFALLAILVATGACSESHVRPATVAESPPAATPPLPAPVNEAKSPARGVVQISPEIRAACGIADADAHFAFDSAHLTDADRSVLHKVATCFVSGPLAHRDMRLVGHADPRGDSDYNMVLGGSRADTVKTFLVLGGLPGSRIATSSRGELDARGTDETGWAEDRRVDIMAH